MLRPLLCSFAPCRLHLLWQKGVKRWPEAGGGQMLLICGQSCSWNVHVKGSAES